MGCRKLNTPEEIIRVAGPGSMGEHRKIKLHKKNQKLKKTLDSGKYQAYVNTWTKEAKS